MFLLRIAVTRLRAQLIKTAIRLGYHGFEQVCNFEEISTLYEAFSCMRCARKMFWMLQQCFVSFPKRYLITDSKKIIDPDFSLSLF